MKTLQRLALTALALGLGAQFATSPVLADKPSQGAWASIELTSVGDEPQATGQAIVNSVKYEGNSFGYSLYAVKASVICWGLTPGATYQTDLGTFTANRNGKGAINGTVHLLDNFSGGYEHSIVFDWLIGVKVVRLNPNGSSTLVLVCSWE